MVDLVVEEIIKRLKSMRSQRNIDGMARYGITSENCLGIPTNELKNMAKKHRRDHALALELWETGIYDARVIAFLIDDWRQVTEGQMERWVKDFDSWAVCDGCCLHLFGDTPFAWRKAVEWAKRDGEYIKRAGYTLMAVLAVHDKQSTDKDFVRLLPLIKKGSTDERKYVYKAVNWALRQIGKRNLALNQAAIETGEEILALDTKAVRWIAHDALRELRGEAVQRRLHERAEKMSPSRARKARKPVKG